MTHAIASTSMLKEVEKCHTSAFLKSQGLYSIGDPAQSYRLQAGIAIHEVLHSWLRELSDDYCMSKFIAMYRPYSDKFVESNNAYHSSNLERLIAYWLSTHPIKEQRYRLVKGEYPRRAWLGKHELSDKSDAIVEDITDGTLMAIEHKSTGSKVTAEFAMLKRCDPQFKQHVYVCRANGYEVAGVLLNAIQINKIPDPVSRKCAEHKIAKQQCWTEHIKSGMFPITYSPEEMETWVSNTENALEEYYELISGKDISQLSSIPQQGIVGDRCGYCDYRRFCDSGRRNMTLLAPRSDRDDGEEIIHSGIVED